MELNTNRWDHDFRVAVYFGQASDYPVQTIEFDEGPALEVVGCGHAEAYWQVDAYRADVNNDGTLYLICDHCNDEGAQDI